MNNLLSIQFFIKDTTLGLKLHYFWLACILSTIPPFIHERSVSGVNTGVLPTPMLPWEHWGALYVFLRPSKGIVNMTMEMEIHLFFFSQHTPTILKQYNCDKPSMKPFQINNKKKGKLNTLVINSVLNFMAYIQFWG